MKLPITTKVFSIYADLVTPVSAFLRCREKYPDAVLFESADSHGGTKQFSYICFDTIASLNVTERAYTIKTWRDLKVVEEATEALPAPKSTALAYCMEQFLSLFKEQNTTSDSLPADVANGAFGFSTYDSIELCETLCLTKPPVESEKLPLAHYRLFRFVLVFDHLHEKLHILQNVPENTPVQEFAPIVSLITSEPFKTKQFRRTSEAVSNMTDAEHIEIIKQCQVHIKRGDVFQIVPSRKFSRTYEGDDFNVYRALRVINPSPYLFYFKTPEFTLFGSSPEAQIIVKGNKASIHPIAGTYPRRGTDLLDQEAAKQLVADEKEGAEHVMLVDLARNDLSIHCHPVTVERFKEVEFYSHVIHLVSRVSGTLLDGVAATKVFSSTAPAGTLSGAPKYMAMQILDRIEPSRRHFYGGSIGLLSLNGDIVHGIMIRTFLSKEQVLYSQAGSGIVLDSVPDKEVAEVKNKLAALEAAINKAEDF